MSRASAERKILTHSLNGGDGPP